MIQDFQKINKVCRDSGIHDITNKCNPNFTRSFSNSEQVMFTSVDRKPEVKDIKEYQNNKPNKLKPYASISDEPHEILNKRQEKSNFMNRWNASVVDSIDFQGDKKNCDIRDCKDALNCALYAVDVHNHCLKTEVDVKANSNYMKTQSDINEKMRGILIDWLIEVHLKFKLLPETLYLTISTIDRYLSVADVHRSKLQLVGVTSMLIACKYEEIYPPEVRDFVYITDKAYSAEEVLDMEVSILNALEFNFTVPSILKFIDRYIKVLELDAKTYMTAKYLSELSLLDVKYLKSMPSRLAAAAVYLSVKINKNADANWNQDLCELSRLQEKDIRETAKILCSILKSYGSDKTSLQAVRKKYLLEKYMKVARVEIQN
eukprot:Mrub_04539.p1 GENE.Mrub_04539~~Mrub_04539.p1  ORF type:complete len:391 (+),score=129.13 Mrub_04539:53-1174(+)